MAKKEKKGFTKPFFSHKLGASKTPQMVRLCRKKGDAAGFYYWWLLEEVFDKDGVLRLDDLPEYAYDLHLDENGEKLLESIVRDFGLFEVDDENHTFTSPLFAEQMEHIEEISKIRSEARKGKKNNAGENELTIDEETGEILHNETEKAHTGGGSMSYDEFFIAHPNIAKDMKADSPTLRTKQVDFRLLSDRINESPQLQKLDTLIGLVSVYDNIIAGKYS